MTAAAPETPAVTPGQAAKSRVSVEATELNEAETGWVTAGVFVERDGEPDPDLAYQALDLNHGEMRALYDGLRLYYEQGIWSFRTVEREAIAARQPQPAPGDDEPELTEHVTVRFPAGMTATAKQLAAAEGMTVSAWMRREIEREATRREQPAPELATDKADHAELEDACVAAHGRIAELEAEAARLRGLLEDQGRGDEAREFLTPAEAALRLRVHPRTLSRLVAAGKLTPDKTPGGHRRYRAAEIEVARLERAGKEAR